MAVSLVVMGVRRSFNRGLAGSEKIYWVKHLPKEVLPDFSIYVLVCRLFLIIPQLVLSLLYTKNVPKQKYCRITTTRMISDYPLPNCITALRYQKFYDTKMTCNYTRGFNINHSSSTFSALDKFFAWERFS